MIIHEKLKNIQKELKAPKSQYNSFGKYNYRNCEDILEAVKPLLNKYEASLTLSDEILEIGGKNYIRATATLYDCVGEESICVSAYARESTDKKGMDDSQMTGATSSYARKYALNGLFCIDDTKDADYLNQGQKEAKKGNSEPQRASYTCHDCKKAITKTEKHTAEQIAENTMKRCGVHLCMACYQKRAEASQGGKKNAQ